MRPRLVLVLALGCADPAPAAAPPEPPAATTVEPRTAEPATVVGEDPMDAVRRLMEAEGLAMRPIVPIPEGLSPDVVARPPEISSPALAVEPVARLVHRHLRDVHDCYAIALATARTLEGTLAIRLVVGPGGAVTDAEHADGELAADAETALELERCVHAAAGHWTFAAPDGGEAVTIVQRYTLAPTGGHVPPAPMGGLDIPGT